MTRMRYLKCTSCGSFYVMKLYSELFCTYSMEEKNRVIHILEEHQIPYKISTNGNTMRNLGSRGMALDQFGEKPEVSCEYRIRVPKEQLEQAQHLSHLG